MGSHITKVENPRQYTHWYFLSDGILVPALDTTPDAVKYLYGMQTEPPISTGVIIGHHQDRWRDAEITVVLYEHPGIANDNALGFMVHIGSDRELPRQTTVDMWQLSTWIRYILGSLPDESGVPPIQVPTAWEIIEENYARDQREADQAQQERLAAFQAAQQKRNAGPRQQEPPEQSRWAVTRSEPPRWTPDPSSASEFIRRLIAQDEQQLAWERDRNQREAREGQPDLFLSRQKRRKKRSVP
jgi:hypothetical protein